MNLSSLSLAGLLAIAHVAHADFSFPYTTKSSSSTPASDTLVLEYKQAIEQLNIAKVQELLATKFPTSQTQLNHIVAIAHITAEQYRLAQDSSSLALKDIALNIASPVVVLAGAAVFAWGVKRGVDIHKKQQALLAEQEKNRKAVEEAQGLWDSGMAYLKQGVTSLKTGAEAIANSDAVRDLADTTPVQNLKNTYHDGKTAALEASEAPVEQILLHKVEHNLGKLDTFANSKARQISKKLNKPVEGYQVEVAAGFGIMAFGAALSFGSNKLQRIAYYQQAQEIYQLLIDVASR